ncbi:ATP-binding protein [Micromonospora sp. NPDC005215]|uniref:ATP-binding protein n=1 Tax=Micromonospora sp. NPDC005215 TaxID=3157024 RepID=UPI0033B9CD8B
MGELLVGRASTALLELIKNAYDADASDVILHAQNIDSSNGLLQIVDNGNGMTYERFNSAFLRIAGRDKEGATRRSPRYGRRYTGQKGIGRLAAHKLASTLKVVSVPWPEVNAESGRSGVSAFLDWDVIEEQDTLNDLQAGIHVERLGIPSTPQNRGTSIELGRLRVKWTSPQLAAFVGELRTAQPPPALTDANWLPGAIVGERIIDQPLVRDATQSNDPGFNVTYSGDLDVGDDFWDQAGSNFQWLIEIDSLGDVVKYKISPLQSYAKQEPEAKPYYFEKPNVGPDKCRFQARIFTNPNSSTRRGPLAGFVQSNSGVRVYLEGFRVLPYGEHGNDWLGLDRDYRSGPRFYKIDIDQKASDALEEDKKEALSATSNIGYFGAVFLTEENSRGLKSLVNREGFVPNEAFSSLVDLVRTGVQLGVRVRRAVANLVTERERANAAAETEATDNELRSAPSQPVSRERSSGNKNEGDQAGSGPEPDAAQPKPGRQSDVLAPLVINLRAEVIIDNARAVAARLRSLEYPLAEADELNTLLSGFRVAQSELDRLQSLQPDLRVLASVGLQLGAFVHDVNGMLGQASTVRQLLNPLLLDPELSRSGGQRVRRVVKALDELTHSLSRQSSYLTDVLVADPRRRRSRQKLKERLAVVERLLHDQLAKRHVVLEDKLGEDLLTPPIFPAEMGVLLTNLLTNAVKNAGSPGRVFVDGRPLGRKGVTLLIHNTGVAVDLGEANRWFLPFETTTTEVNEVLGQGLGLGLPITKALVEDYRGEISFVEPPAGYATSIRVDLPDPQERR